MNTDIPYKTYLSEDELPKAWYNVRADMKQKPAPLLNPKTLQPCTAAELEQVCPLQKMYTLGAGFIPSASHAGGLRYHGMSAMLSELYAQGLMEARSVEQTKVFEAAVQFARTEGTLPAPESSHAIRAAIDEALRCKAEGKTETIVFGLSGTGYFDMMSYGRFIDGNMSDTIPTDDELNASFAQLPQVNA